MKSPLYYNPGTPSSGSADPLRHAMQMRSVLRNGLGAARGQRLRKGSCASYPTRQFLFLVPSPLQARARGRKAYTQALLFFCGNR